MDYRMFHRCLHPFRLRSNHYSYRSFDVVFERDAIPVGL